MGRPHRKKNLSATPVRCTIESLTHDGRGIARIEGKPVFISGGLPGEVLEFTYTDSRRDYAEGQAVTIHEPSPQRTEPACPSFGICGGCSFQHVQDDAQIVIKQDLLVTQLERTGKVHPETWLAPMKGPHWGYRHKARLGVKYVAKKEKVLVGFRERSTPFIADIDTCPVLHPRVGLHLRTLGEAIARLSIKDRFPQIEVAVGDHRVALICRVLADPSTEDLEILITLSETLSVDLYLQRQGPDSIRLLAPLSAERLSYETPGNIRFEFEPSDFTQVNMAINRQMIERVLELLELKPEDTVMDLFCGIGNFTLPIARKVSSVTGVEGVESAVQRARDNAVLNGITNAAFHVGDLTKGGVGEPWLEQAYTKVLLDPSRAGAEDILPALQHWKPERIVYVSCNPSTLARDAGILVHQLGYRLLSAGVMDMFPQTAHVESMAVFVR